jgi:hypothetical protein
MKMQGVYSPKRLEVPLHKLIIYYDFYCLVKKLAPNMVLCRELA